MHFVTHVLDNNLMLLTFGDSIVSSFANGFYISISPHSLFLIVSITRDCNGRTPLHFAAACGHVGILSTLLQAVGSGVHMDNHGYTPLHWACFNGIFL